MTDTSNLTVALMILEASLSIVLNPEDMGFYIGPFVLEAASSDGMNAHAFIIKLWCIMVQFTAFSPYKK